MNKHCVHPPSLPGFSTQKPHKFKEVPIFPTTTGLQNCDPSDHHLYVPNITNKDLVAGVVQPFRRVAIVEEFFDIIYNVHVGLGGRSGRHAGQKRTYRTITETYAFLPRDAVTKFLAGCSTCNNKPPDCEQTSTVNHPMDEDYNDDEVETICRDASLGIDCKKIVELAKSETTAGIYNNTPKEFESGKLDVSQDLMNYYQLLRVMYSQSLTNVAQSNVNISEHENELIATSGSLEDDADIRSDKKIAMDENTAGELLETNNNDELWKADCDVPEKEIYQLDVKKNEFGKCVELRSIKTVS